MRVVVQKLRGHLKTSHNRNENSHKDETREVVPISLDGLDCTNHGKWAWSKIETANALMIDKQDSIDEKLERIMDEKFADMRIQLDKIESQLLKHESDKENPNQRDCRKTIRVKGSDSRAPHHK